MIRVSLDRLLEMAKGEVVVLSEQGETVPDRSQNEIHGVSTDSREDLTGKLFIPLVGDRFDGHDFISKAVEKGASAVLWQRDKTLPAGLPEHVFVVLVQDTLLALQQLARAYRSTLPVKIIGVTGSNGKTSTKDLLASVLSVKHKVQKTIGNLNNHIGLPLMVLSLATDTEYAILEMGMSGMGEIALLADIARPNVAVITNIGEAHIEYLGSRDNIARAKFELVEALDAAGKAFLFGDEPLLRELEHRSPASIKWFGFNDDNDTYPCEVDSKGLRGTSFRVHADKTDYYLPIPGLHQLGNALASIAVAKEVGMSSEEIASGLAEARLSAMRLEVTPGRRGGFVVNDAYNASPTSMRAALQMLAETIDGDGRIGVIGDMLELGQDAERMHREIGQFAGNLGLDGLFVVGQFAPVICEEAIRAGMPESIVHGCVDKKEAIPVLIEACQHFSAPIVLVKASRGMKMEDIVQVLI